MKKILFLVYTCLISVALLVACSVDQAPTTTAKTDGAPKQLIIGTGSMSGVYYPIGGAIATIINEKVQGVSATIQSTAGGVENLRLLKQKEIDVGMVGTSTAFYAYDGIEVFKDEKIDTIRGLAVLYPQPVQIVVAKDSPVQSFHDLVGKKVGVGPPASGDEAVFRELMSVAGYTYDDFEPQYISFSEQSSAFKDRQLDAMTFTAGVPTSGILDVASVKDVRLIPLDGELRENLLKKFPYYTKGIIPKGTYPGQDTDVETIIMPAYLVCSSDLSDEHVYAMLSALYENLDELAKAHAQGKNITLEGALQGSSIPLHPGAEKFYREKGLLK